MRSRQPDFSKKACLVFGEGSNRFAPSFSIGIVIGEWPHDCDIGNHVHIALGVVLSGGVKIADNCHTRRILNSYM